MGDFESSVVRSEGVGSEMIRNTESAIYFNFSYAALKLLGKNLYSNSANAISELVANSIDAQASEIYVYIDMSDKEHSRIEILDNGIGMDYHDLSEKYVWIGRNRRADNDFDKPDNSIMGRKGIGKLAALYLSNCYYILTRKNSNEAENKWKVDLLKYKDSDFPKLDKADGDIYIENLALWNSFKHGTLIILENVDLRGNGEKRIEALRRVFADYYLVESLSSRIYVSVITDDNQTNEFSEVKKRIAFKNFYALFDNSGYDIKSRMSDSVCFTWSSKYEHIANKPRQTVLLDAESYNTFGRKVFHKEDRTEIIKTYRLSGWIAVHCTIEQKNALDKNYIRNSVYNPNRLRLYVRKKLAVDDYFSISPSTQAMANYIEGEISFDILDDDDLPDIATSSRQDFLADERIELLVSIVDPIIKTLFNYRNKVGKEITDENKEYEAYLIEEEKRKKEEADKARKKAENDAREAFAARDLAEKKSAHMEIENERERRRSKYIYDVSKLEDKNIMNAVHTIYGMSDRVKRNLDALNNIEEHSSQGKRKLENASISNQRILTVSKVISKTGHIIDDNDSLKSTDIASFVDEYVEKVLSHIYDEISFSCIGDTGESFVIDLKPVSFIMMLDNIVGNSIKASATEIRFVLNNSNDSEYSIVIKDNGIGIDPSVSDTRRLFDFGYTTTNGSGLGLFYAKKTMDGMGGSINIYQNEGMGVSIELTWKKE